MTKHNRIWILGPGRSGTSCMAQIFRRSGFDLGFREDPFFVEHDDLVSMNAKILTMLYEDPKHRPGFGEPNPPDWRDKIPGIVEELGDEIRAFCKTAPEVLKDPRWGHTIFAWIESGVLPEVAVHLRRDDEMCAKSCFKWCEKKLLENSEFLSPDSGEGPKIRFSRGQKPQMDRVMESVIGRREMLDEAVTVLQQKGVEVFHFKFPEYTEERDRLVSMLCRLRPQLSRADAYFVLNKTIFPNVITENKEKA